MLTSDNKVLCIQIVSQYGEDMMSSHVEDPRHTERTRGPYPALEPVYHQRILAFYNNPVLEILNTRYKVLHERQQRLSVNARKYCSTIRCMDPKITSSGVGFSRLAYNTQLIDFTYKPKITSRNIYCLHMRFPSYEYKMEGPLVGLKLLTLHSSQPRLIIKTDGCV